MGTFNKQKAFGQHFLKDTHVIQTIVDSVIEAAKAYPDHAVLEIGPGKGAITRPLLEQLPIDTKFYLAERDRELIEFWEGESRVTKILKGDFLTQSDDELSAIGPMIVVSNLPYSAGTAIVVKLSEKTAQIPKMILMFQAEVSKRLYANASTPDRGSLSLYIQNEWDVKRLIVVKPDAFNPPPKVMSEVVTLSRRDEALIAVPNLEKREAFNQLLKIAFKHRRKMIKGNFAGTDWQAALEKSGVAPTLRAEALEWKDWINLWKSSTL
jgi:16S rRNA (adenine1518-N6/adenine1519-N6)-dimethyltransferase